MKVNRLVSRDATTRYTNTYNEIIAINYKK